MHVCVSGERRQAERRHAWPANHLGGSGFGGCICQCLLSWAQGLCGASSFLQPFSQSIIRGTFSSIIMIKIIIINTAVACISPESFIPRTQNFGQTANLRAFQSPSRAWEASGIARSSGCLLQLGGTRRCPGDRPVPGAALCERPRQSWDTAPGALPPHLLSPSPLTFWDCPVPKRAE